MRPSRTGSMLSHTRSSFLDLFIERPNGSRIRIVEGRVDHATIPEYIIHADQSTRPQQHQGALIIVGVVGLVGIDEHEIEPVRLAASDQSIQGVERGPMRRSIFRSTPASRQ